MTKDEALKLALESLEFYYDLYREKVDAEAITAIKEALAQPEQEPIVCPYCKNSATLGAVYYDQNCLGCVKRMTVPPYHNATGLD